jgi:hypothetical protein
MRTRTNIAGEAAVAVAVVAAAVTYGIYAVHPWQGATPLNQFLATFGRADTTAWPMQLVWYAAALAMAGLALWPARRWSSPLICGLAAAYFAWIGIGYFAWLSPGIGLPGAGRGRAVLVGRIVIGRIEGPLEGGVLPVIGGDHDHLGLRAECGIQPHQVPFVDPGPHVLAHPRGPEAFQARHVWRRPAECIAVQLL